MVGKAVRQFLRPDHIGQAAAHEALDRGNRVLRIGGDGVLRRIANLATAAFQVAHHGRQDDTPFAVGQAFGHAMAHGGHQGVRGAQVNAHGNAALVRIGRLAGFRYL